MTDADTNKQAVPGAPETHSRSEGEARSTVARAERILSPGQVERTLKRRVEERVCGAGGLGLSGLCVEGTLGASENLRRFGKKIYGVSLTDNAEGVRLDLAVPAGLEEDLYELEHCRVMVRGDLEARPFKSTFRFQLNVHTLEAAGGDATGIGGHHQADKSLAAVLKGYRRRARPFPKTDPASSVRVLVLHPSTGVALRDFAEGLGDAVVEAEASPVATNNAAAMREAVLKASCDVLILARGGGPAEDLLPFDDPALAEAWMEHPAYTISAVGHAQDATVIDALSDAACPTPTAAGTFVAKKASEVVEIAAARAAAAGRDADVRSLTAARDAARKTAMILGAGFVLLLLVVFYVVAT